MPCLICRAWHGISLESKPFATHQLSKGLNPAQQPFFRNAMSQVRSQANHHRKDIVFLFVEPHFFTLINERTELGTPSAGQKCHVWFSSLDMAFFSNLNFLLLTNYQKAWIQHSNHFSEMLCLRSNLGLIATTKTLHFSLLNLISLH